MFRLTAFVFVAILISSNLYLSIQPWERGAWDAADHNRDGILTRQEMEKFGNQRAHRNGKRLLMHFDAADVNRDQIVDDQEIEDYGYNIGSKDPMERSAGW